MQDPTEDTEWNDILRAKGILPPKPKEAEITEDDLLALAEESIKKLVGNAEKSVEDMTLEELDELEDEESEKIAQQYRARRIAEMKAAAERSKFGDLVDITSKEYKQEVNEAGKGIWVVVFLYKAGIPVCTRLQQHLRLLCRKFPAVKFVQSVSTNCIPNYPDKNLPSLFVYFEGDLKHQFVGPTIFGGETSTADDVEWALSQLGAVETELEENPRLRRAAKTSNNVHNKAQESDDDDDD